MSARPQAPSAAAPAALDVARVREDFPVLHQEVRGRPLVYLDNAATAQKPRAVIEAVARYYERDNANIHRGVHALSERATEAYEGARERLRRFLHAADRREIVFLRGATEAINLVAQTFGRSRLGPGDEVLLTQLEHHSNIVPWQLLAQERGVVLRVAPIRDDGSLDLEAFLALLGPRTRLVAVAHVSNALGTVLPVGPIVEAAHAVGARVLLDGAQAAPHLPVDVQALGCDFYCLSGHKLYGPTGIGVLYARLELLEELPPWQGGGDMIRTVSFSGSTFADPPHKFEAGTPHIAGAIGLGAAVDYLEGLGMEAVRAHEEALLAYATEAVAGVPGLRLVGTAPEKAGILSFVLEGVHPHDIGTILDHEGVAVRAGHHCAMPVMERFGLAATARASFGLYNTREEVDALVDALHRVREIFG
ncbi:MAG: cysteine desulfurase [Gammaproteobacteria bacterium]|nr:MAG: cysteine desulfurase [Gammaproteobacteria bacterium]